MTHVKESPTLPTFHVVLLSCPERLCQSVLFSLAFLVADRTYIVQAEAKVLVENGPVLANKTFIEVPDCAAAAKDANSTAGTPADTPSVTPTRHLCKVRSLASYPTRMYDVPLRLPCKERNTCSGLDPPLASIREGSVAHHLRICMEMLDRGALLHTALVLLRR